jgi:hypothetical protein
VPTLAGGLACAATTSLARRLGSARAGLVADHGGSHLAPEAMAAYGESLAILERVVVAPAVGRFYPTELAGREAGSGTRIQLEGSDRHARASAPPLQVLDLTHYLRHRIAHTGQRSKD